MKSNHNREIALKIANEKLMMKRTQNQEKLAKWELFKQEKDKRLKEAQKRLQIQKMLKFWVGINIVRKIIKKANFNYKVKLGIAG